MTKINFRLQKLNLTFFCLISESELSGQIVPTEWERRQSIPVQQMCVCFHKPENATKKLKLAYSCNLRKKI